MEIRIESDGTPRGTRILTEDGREIRNVRSVGWKIESRGVPVVTLELIKTPVTLKGHAWEGDTLVTEISEDAEQK